MAVDKDEKESEAAPDATPLAPGVWVTEATGFACVPPRAQSDFRAAPAPDEHEASDEDPECGTRLARDEIQPRIEKYRER